MNINPELLKLIAEIGSKVLYDPKTQKMLLSEEGVLTATSMTTALMLSRVAKGESKMQFYWALIAASGLNDCDAQERLLKNHEIEELEATVASMVLVRIGEEELTSLPANLDEYREMINAMKCHDFDNRVYRKVASG